MSYASFVLNFSTAITRTQNHYYSFQPNSKIILIAFEKSRENRRLHGSHYSVVKTFIIEFNRFNSLVTQPSRHRDGMRQPECLLHAMQTKKKILTSTKCFPINDLFTGLFHSAFTVRRHAYYKFNCIAGSVLIFIFYSCLAYMCWWVYQTCIACNQLDQLPVLNGLFVALFNKWFDF